MEMKRTLTLILWLVTSMTMMAEHLTRQQAEEAAKAFLDRQKSSVHRGQLRLARQQPLHSAVTSEESTAYYVFNIGDDAGYVLVSGDDRTPAILGYAESGRFVSSELPSNMEAWLNSVADQIDYLVETDGRNERPRLRVERSAVSPLLHSTWNQDAPYNNACPVDPSTSERSATGCVATAMAQVLNYYRYPAQTTASIPAYTTPTRAISMSAIPVTTIDWPHMLDSYGPTATAAEQEAVARLMLLCGQSVQMNYTSNASGAQSTALVNALQNYFGYDKTTRILTRNAFSADDWDELLYTEVAAGRPVLFGAQSTGGGHEFVIDGYSSDGLFHVNWGWGGSSNGYFLISVLNPGSTSGIGSSNTDDGYSFDQDAVVGIQHGTGEAVAELMTVYSLSAGTTSFTRSSANDDFTGISLTATFYNMSGVSADNMVFGLALADSNGEWLSDDILIGYNFGTLAANYGSGGYPFRGISFGSGLADGTYYIKPFSGSGDLDTQELRWAYGSNVYQVKAVISGNTLTLTNPTVSMNAVISTEGKTEMGRQLQLKAAITNQGTRFNDYVYLLVNGVQKGARSFEAEEGDTRDFEIDFMPTATGTTEVSLAYDQNGTLTTFATTTITVAEPTAGMHLSGTITIVNATDGTVTTDPARVQVAVTNDGSGDYDQQVQVSVWKYNSSDGYYYLLTSVVQNLVLPLGQTTTVNAEFAGLEDKADYLVTFEYVNEGKSVRDTNRGYFSTDYPEETTQTLQLAEGWNWVSGYLQEPLPLSQLSEHSSRIVSQEQELIRDPQYGMVGTLTALEAGKSYKVLAMTDFAPTFSGHPFDAAGTPIALQKGWNWIGYPHTTAAALSAALADAEEGDRIASQTGFAEYADGSWEGSLSTLTPGTGYLYMSANAKQLNITTMAASRGEESSEADETIPAMRRYPNTMNIVATIVRNEAPLEGDRYSITAMAGNELRGKSIAVGSRHYLTVYGEEPVELRFVVEDTQSGQTFTAKETQLFSDGLLGSRNAPAVMHIGVTTGIDGIASEATPTTISTLDGIVVSRQAAPADLRRLRKGLYIVDGRKFYVK